MVRAVVVMPPSTILGETGEDQYLVGWSVGGASAPGLAFAVPIGDVSLLHDRINAAAGMKRCVQHGAGADSVRLARGLRHDASVGRAVDRGQLSQVVKASLELACGDQCLSGGGRGGADGDLGRSGGVGALQTTATGYQKVDAGRSDFDVLGLQILRSDFRQLWRVADAAST